MGIERLLGYTPFLVVELHFGEVHFVLMSWIVITILSISSGAI